MKKVISDILVTIICVVGTLAGIIGISLAFAACTDAQQAKIGGYGQTFKVEVISGGQVVRTYKSTGKVLSESSSDGYYFTDADTNKLVEISGDVIVTEE